MDKIREFWQYISEHLKDVIVSEVVVDYPRLLQIISLGLKTSDRADELPLQDKLRDILKHDSYSYRLKELINMYAFIFSSSGVIVFNAMRKILDIDPGVMMLIVPHSFPYPQVDIVLKELKKRNIDGTNSHFVRNMLCISAGYLTKNITIVEEIYKHKTDLPQDWYVCKYEMPAPVVIRKQLGEALNIDISGSKSIVGNSKSTSKSTVDSGSSISKLSIADNGKTIHVIGDIGKSIRLLAQHVGEYELMTNKIVFIPETVNHNIQGYIDNVISSKNVNELFITTNILYEVVKSGNITGKESDVEILCRIIIDFIRRNIYFIGTPEYQECIARLKHVESTDIRPEHMIPIDIFVKKLAKNYKVCQVCRVLKEYNCSIITIEDPLLGGDYCEYCWTMCRTLFGL